VHAGVASGAIASLLSTALLATVGKLEGGSATGPINGPSQWLWGRQAARRRRPSLRHTIAGYAIHHATSSGWAILHERFYGPTPAATFAQEVARGAVTAALACAVDYQATPRRLRPGFETQLSRKSLAVVYASFAIGLALARYRR
jgi:hypothetical protein